MTASPGTEDPIAALFDLADRVSEVGPKVQRIHRVGAALILGFLVVLVYLLFRGLDTSLLLVGLALAALVLGVISLDLLVEADRYYAEFAERHRRLRLL